MAKLAAIIESYREYTQALNRDKAWASKSIAEDPAVEKRGFKRIYAMIAAETKKLGWVKKARMRDGERLFVLGKLVGRTIRSGKELSVGEIWGIMHYWKHQEFVDEFIFYMQAYRSLNSEEEEAEDNGQTD